VLFLCTANVCRSPFMELTASHLAGPDAPVTFASAGTRGFDDSEISPDMATTLAVRGVPGAARFRSRPFTEGMIDDPDLILTAETTHRQLVLDDHPEALRKVFTLGQFADAVRALGPSLTGRDLLTVVSERRGTASPTLDIADPYQQGPEVAEDCANTIERLLRVVVPALSGSGRIDA
jgi:sulfate adenylyltransferase